MSMIKANNAEFYYELHGSGYPIVLIAGYACDHAYWAPVLQDLMKHYQVLIFDNRAVGQTKDSGGSLSIELMAEDVMAICEGLNLKKPHIVGQSMGGMIAQSIAVSYAEKINKLAILTSSAKCRETMLFAFKSLLQMRKDNINFDIIFDAMLPWVFGDEFLANPDYIEAYKLSFIRNKYQQSLADQMRQFLLIKEFDGREQLKSICSPTLVINGVQDVISLPRESEFMVNQIVGAKRIELNCAHAITAEAYQLLPKILMEFLR
jgi:3-oxoadipate enol-lactonase